MVPDLSIALLSGLPAAEGGREAFFLLWTHIHAKPAGQHCPSRCLLCLLHLQLSPVTTLDIYSRLRHYRAISNDQHQGDQTRYKLSLRRIIGIKKKALLLIYQIQPKCGCTMCSDFSQVCRLLLFTVNK